MKPVETIPGMGIGEIKENDTLVSVPVIKRL
jgi:hypothetical protein